MYSVHIMVRDDMHGHIGCGLDYKLVYRHTWTVGLVSILFHSDGEGRGGNPLVSGFQDDLDPDDRESAAKPLPPAAAASLGVTLSSDEEDNAKPSTAAAAMGMDSMGWDAQVAHWSLTSVGPALTFTSPLQTITGDAPIFKWWIC